jgi:hypothetical protein
MKLNGTKARFSFISKKKLDFLLKDRATSDSYPIDRSAIFFSYDASQRDAHAYGRPRSHTNPSKDVTPPGMSKLNYAGCLPIERCDATNDNRSSIDDAGRLTI